MKKSKSEKKPDLPALWEEMQARNSSLERQEEILTFLEAHRNNGQEALLCYMNALAYRILRETNWERRSARFEILCEAVRQAESTTEILNLFARTAWIQFNAELELAEKILFAELFRNTALAAEAGPDTQLTCAKGLMEIVRLAPNAQLRMKNAETIRKIAGRPDALPETLEICAKALLFVLKCSGKGPHAWSALKRIFQVWKRNPKSSEISLAKMQALQVMTRREMTTADRISLAAILEEDMQCSDALLSSGKTDVEAQKILNLIRISYVDGITALTAAESDLENRLLIAARLFMYAESPNAPAIFREGAIRVMIPFMHTLPTFFIRSVQKRFRDYVRGKTASLELRMQYALFLIRRIQMLEVSESAGEAKRLLNEFMKLTEKFQDSCDSNCLRAAAVLLTMHWENLPKKRMERIELAGGWNSILKSRFADILRECRTVFLENEEDTAVRQLFLDAMR